MAEAYAEEVMGYDDPDVLTVMVNPTGLERRDASRLTDEEREQLQADSFGNPQAIGIYDRSDDHPLGGSAGRVTVIHAPKSAVFMVDDGAAGFGLTAESEADAQAKAKREADALAAEQKAKADEQARLKREANKREADARAAEILAEREAAKKAEVDAAADDFALGQEPPKPVDKKVDAKDLAGQKDIFSSPAPETPKTPETPPKRAPKSFRQSHKVTTQVFMEETGAFAEQEVDADTALTALAGDIKALTAFRDCIAGV